MRVKFLRALVAVSAVTLAVTASLRAPAPSGATKSRRPHHERFSKVGHAGDETVESQIAAEQFAQARTAPGVVLPGAYGAAFASLAGLPVYGQSWAEVTNRPYDSDDPRYRDPFASNSSGGAGLVAGRITGAILVFRLLEHKQGLQPLDHELFELLGVHASTALYCANLHNLTAAAVR